jgi:hypothetical protein
MEERDVDKSLMETRCIIFNEAEKKREKISASFISNISIKALLIGVNHVRKEIFS